MPKDDAYLIEKIASHEADLIRIYAAVYPVLKAADPATLPDIVAAELLRFDSPEIIAPSKAAAILKAMRGSTPDDKFYLENCFFVSMPSGQSVSSFVGDRLQELGVAYHDFWPYLRARGWLNEY